MRVHNFIEFIAKPERSVHFTLKIIITDANLPVNKFSVNETCISYL